MPGKGHVPDLTERLIRSFKANTTRTAGGLATNASPSIVRDRARAATRSVVGSGRGSGTVNIKHYNEILKAIGVPPGSVVDEPWFSSDCSSTALWTSTTVTVEAARNGDGFKLGTAYKDLGDSKSAEVLVGFAFQTGLTGLSGTGSLVEFRGDSGATLHLKVVLGTDGTLTAVSNAVTLATATEAIGTGWQYVEVRVVLGNGTGLVQIRVDGEEVAANTACDTRNGGTVEAIDRVLFDDHTADTWLDDVYIDVGTAWADEDPAAEVGNPNDFADATPAVPDAAGAYSSETVANAGFDTETGEPS